MVIHSGAASSNRKFGNPEDIERFGNLETPKILKGAFGVSVSGLFHFYFLLYFSVSLHLYIFLSLSLSFYFSVLFLSVYIFFYLSASVSLSLSFCRWLYLMRCLSLFSLSLPFHRTLSLPCVILDLTLFNFPSLVITFSLFVSKTLAYSLSVLCLKDTSLFFVIYVSQRH